MTFSLTHLRDSLVVHRNAILCAFFVGLLFILPQTLARIELGSDYHGAPFLYQSDDENYLANIQEIIEGNISASSPIYHGYKNYPATILPFGEYLYAVPAIVFHLPITFIITVSKFIFPSILFLLVYTLIFFLVRGREEDINDAKLNALTGGLLVVLGYDFVDLGHMVGVVRGFSDSGYLSVWARLVNPITGGLFLFTFLILLWRILNRSSRTLPFVAGGLVAVMSGYFFSFAVALSITFVLFLTTLLQRKDREAWSLLQIAGIGSLPLLFNIVSVFRNLYSPGGGHSLTKIGLFYTHVPVINKLLFVSMVLFLVASFIMFKKKPGFLKEASLWWWYCLTLLISVFLVFVQQIITGMAIWPQHFVQYSIPIVYTVGIVMLYKFIHPWSKSIWMVCVYLILITTVLYGIWTVLLYKNDMKSYLSDQRYTPIFAWFNAVHTKNDCVVLVSEDINYLSGKIPAYTHCDVYYSVQNYYGVPQERIEHGYFSWLRLRGITSEDITVYLNNHRTEVRTTSFTNWLELWRDSRDPWLKSIQSEEELSRWENDATSRLVVLYKDFLANDFKMELKKFKLDYILWDSLRYGSWNPQNFSFLSEVYRSGGLVVFKVNL